MKKSERLSKSGKGELWEKRVSSGNPPGDYSRKNPQKKRPGQKKGAGKKTEKIGGGAWGGG